MKAKLGNISTIVRGSSPRPQGDPRYYGKGVPRLMVADLTRDGMYVNAEIDSLTEEGAKLSRPMKAGEIVIAVSGNPGLPAILNHDACIHDGFVGLRELDTKTAQPTYLYHFLQFNKLQTKSKAVGAIFKNLTTDQIKDIEVPLPALSEQQKIAAILSQVDAAREKRKQANALTEQFLQSTFLTLFGDPVKNEKGWEVKKLIDVVHSKGGGTPSKSNSDYYNGNIPWVTPKDMKTPFIYTSIDKITEQAIAESSTSLIPKNSVLVVVRSGILKNTLPLAVNEVPVTINQDMKAFLCKGNINPYFLMFHLDVLSEYILGFVRATTADNISSDVLKDIDLIIPPLSLQQKFADIVNQTEQLRIKQRQSEQELEQLFQSLLQRYFG